MSVNVRVGTTTISQQNPWFGRPLFINLAYLTPMPKSPLSARERAIRKIHDGERMLARAYAGENGSARAILRAVRLLDRAERESLYPDDAERIAYVSRELMTIVLGRARAGAVYVHSPAESSTDITTPLFPDPAE